MHQTLETFDYPNSELLATDHWLVLLRPRQVTLGSLILAVRDDIRSLGALPVSAAQEMPIVVSAIETALRSTLSAEKFNYLCLMMVDPQVHFHVIPRYSRAARFDEVEYHDDFWPGPPDVTSALSIGPEAIVRLTETLDSALAQELEDSLKNLHGLA